jgi:hypothetical protein
MNRFSWVICIGGLLVTGGLAQSINTLRGGFQGTEPRHLSNPELVTARGLTASGFMGPLKCDSNSNMYLRSDTDGVRAIREVNPKGDVVAIFSTNKVPDPNVHYAGQFDVLDGVVHQVIFMSNRADRYFVTFNADGTFRSMKSFDINVDWIPYSIQTFPTGQILATGLRNTAKVDVSFPFTAIFSEDGKFLKEVLLEGDEKITKMGIEGDPRVTSPGHAGTNSAIGQGRMELGDDGNVYVLRHTEPAEVYAISAGGSVVHHFKVDSGDPALQPTEMHLAGGRLAILFRDKLTKEEIIKVLTLEGKEVAAYDSPDPDVKGKEKKSLLGPAFVCFSANPERFTFLSTDDSDQAQFKIFTVR